MKLKVFVVMVVLTALFTSCEKAGQCYTCTFGNYNGYTPPPEEYCGPMPYIKKIDGNEINTFCTPK